MATVRDLTTRFKFETDKRGLTEFRDGLSGAKAAIVGLVGALGLGIAGKAILRSGDSLRQAAILAGQFTDEVAILDNKVTIVGNMADAWERVQAAIPGRETMTDFLNSFAQFRQRFKDAPLADFETLFTAAGNLARITGKPLTTMFETLLTTAESGDVQALVALLPDLGLDDAAMANFVRQLKEIDPTGVLTVSQRMRLVVDLLAKMNPALAETAGLMVETTERGQWDNLLDNMRRMGEIIGNDMKPIMVDLLGTANDFMDVWIDGGVTIGSFRDAFKQVFDIELPAIVMRSLRGISRFLASPLTFFEDVGAGASLFGDRLKGAAGLFQNDLRGLFNLAPGEATERARGIFPERGPRLGFVGGGGVFAPQITVNGMGDGRTIANQVLDVVTDLWGQAVDQFAPQEESGLEFTRQEN